MANAAPDTIASKLRRPPQITLALDSKTHVLYVNRDLAGTGFAGLTDNPDRTLHELLHPDCDGDCRFNRLLNKAWTSLLNSRACVEWEIEDPVYEGRLRLNLSRPPTSRDVAVERRRRFALLTITDITEIRREYLHILHNNAVLQRRIGDLEKSLDDQDVATVSGAQGKHLQQALQLGPRIIAARENERQRIAADLHDGIAQTLGVVKFGVEARIAELSRRHPDIDLSGFEPLVDQIRDALDELRKLSGSLSPAILDEFGVCTAIDILCDEFAAEIPGVEVTCDSCIHEVGLPDAVKVSIYRVIQEALNNIRKHALPERVIVELKSDDGDIVLTISDDGAGFEPESLPERAHGGGMGLRSMRERVEESGGAFELTTEAGKGTKIIARWPAAALQLLGDKPVLDRV